LEKGDKESSWYTISGEKRYGYVGGEPKIGI
jgi:hypothetical protein